MKPKTLFLSVVALLVLILMIQMVRLVDRSAHSKNTEHTSASSDSTADGASTEALKRAAHRGPTAAQSSALSPSPDGRFQAEGGFVTTPNRADFRLKPFPVTHQSDAFAWTGIDGKTPQAMHDLAHTDAEEERLQFENPWVEKRQLVYCDDYIQTLGKSVAGDPANLKAIRLPGFDGQEFEVDVDRTESPQGVMEWNVAGHLKDRPDTLVSISTVHGYTSIVMIAPDFYIEGDAREPGEVVLNQIDRQARRDAKPKNPIAGVNPFNVGAPAPTGP